MNCNQNSEVRPVVIKQVDHNALEGANKGEHRSPALAADITAQFKAQQGPRGETTGTPEAGA